MARAIVKKSRAFFFYFQKGVIVMKKHEENIILLSAFLMIALTAVASGLAYSYVCQAKGNKESCPCTQSVIEMADKKNVSHFYAAAYVERQIRAECGFRDDELVWRSDELRRLEACRKWHAEHDPR